MRQTERRVTDDAGVPLIVREALFVTPPRPVSPSRPHYAWVVALFGLIGPFAASVMDRLGLRRVVLCAVAPIRFIGFVQQSLWRVRMTTVRLVGCLAIATAMGLPLLAQAPGQRKQLLVIGEEKGYRHAAVTRAMVTIERLGRDTGLWDTVIRTDTEALTKQTLEYNARNLNTFDAVVFYTGGSLEMDAQKRTDFLSAIHEDGKGFVGIHSAAITWTDWPEYVAMIGGVFDEHPWGTFAAPVIVEDAAFPGMQAWGSSFTMTDEIYQVKHYSRSDTRVLMRLDASRVDLANPRVHRQDKDFAVAWARMYGRGRVFYSTLGHVEANWDRPEMQTMVTEAIKWALRLVDADVTPRAMP